MLGNSKLILSSSDNPYLFLAKVSKEINEILPLSSRIGSRNIQLRSWLRPLKALSHASPRIDSEVSSSIYIGIRLISVPQVPS